MFLSLLLLLFTTIQPSDAFWRLPCNTRLIAERIDPIVNPGAVSGHVHTISGGSGVAPTSSFAGMRASNCTSCLVTQDLSAYWTPALYFQWANGSFSLVDQIGGGLIYYLQRNNVADKSEILAFPDGLRMLSGNPFLRSYNASSLQAQAIGWSCLRVAEGDPPANDPGKGPDRHPWLPTEKCNAGLRGEIRFPSCWNGVDVDSADHFSHMAFPENDEVGACPSTHPYRVATLFYEMEWYVNPWNNLWNQAKNTSQPFVLANGDPTGFGYHGDFLNGWDRNVLQQAIRQCTDNSGTIELCKVFDLQSTDATCKKTPDVNEIVTGTLSSLPGCNPVTYGPQNAQPCTPTLTPAIFPSPVAYTGKAPPPGADVLSNAPKVLQKSGHWTYQDCYSDDVGNRALPNGLDTSTKTVEACLAACDAKSYTYCGIEYHGQCWGGNTLATSSVPLGFGYCDLTCDDASLQYCGGQYPTAMELYRRS